MKNGVALAVDKKINSDKLKEKIEEEDKDLKIVDKLPFNSNDLVVITAAKKLCAYVITITEKSPKKKLCCNLLNLELNNKTQIGKVNNGIDFLGFNHKLSNTGKIDVKLRAFSKIRMKRYKKTIDKLYNKKKLIEIMYKQEKLLSTII